jgi:hypothetical protein
MIRQRYDRQRLNAVQPDEVSARRCPATDALVAACRADLSTRPLVVLGAPDAEVARRACLWLDGSWWLQDASASGRLAIRLKALWRDRVPTAALRDDDPWDTGWARNPAALVGLVPRRATLVVLEGGLDPAVLSALARDSSTWRRPVRLLLLA